MRRNRNSNRNSHRPNRNSYRPSRNSHRPSSNRKGKFNYKKRDAAAVKRRAEQSAGNRDQIFKDEFKVFKVQDENDIRILPPTWDDPEHYALDVWVHYGIGSDESSYLCLDKMGQDDKCPICEERAKAEAEGDSDYANSLKPTRRPTCYLIDRSNESDGALLWAMPWTIDRDLSAQSIDKKTGEVIPLDDPYEGYDVSFGRTGKALNTKYVGLSIGRHPSPALDDDDELDAVLEFIQDNPITDTLNFHDAEYISNVFSGHNPNKSGKEEKKEDGKNDDVVSELNWNEVHDFDFDELEDLIEQEGLQEVIDPDDFDEEEELADAICEELEIRKPKTKERHSSASGKSRAHGMRRK